MKKPRFGKLLVKGKTLMLAYDHGLEHGPTDFQDKNADPNFILEIARKAKLNGIVLHKGIAEKYYDRAKDVPLVLKLNGKTRLERGEPISTLVCDVSEALELGASAVGYTIYLGSVHEPEMLETFAQIEHEAHERGVPVIAWMYPRGRAIKGLSKEIIAYAARVGLELGADMVKLQYTNTRALKWAVKMAGKTRVVVAGGEKKSVSAFLGQVQKIMEAGAAGMICGRNIWQAEKPVELAKKVKDIIFKHSQ